MGNRVFAFRVNALGQAAIVALLAAATASCSADSLRLRDGLFTGSTNNQKEIIGSANDQPMPAPLGAGGVERGNLPPPPAVASAEPLPGTPTGWSAVGGEVVTVAPGESLDTLAIKHGVPSTEIARANQIHSPSELKAGRSIIIPVRVAVVEPLPEATSIAKAPTAPKKSSGGTHIVQSGDTLYSIARQYGAKPSEIASLNGLASPDQIKIGQSIILPGGAKATAVALKKEPKVKVEPAKLSVATAEENVLKAPDGSNAVVSTEPKIPAVPAIAVEKGTPPVGTVAAAKAIDEVAEAASSNGTSFRWPVRGRIIAGFGTKPNGEKNDGINLAVPEGTSVKAAEAGTVIYAGNELEGYGNLVLIRHKDGWVSAYAHNKQIAVKRGDVVRRGETVAQAGMSGSVTAPQVHFELRKGAKPVNPLDYLAGT